MKGLFFEALHFSGLDPKELYNDLEKNQPNFEREETEKQLQYDYHDSKIYFKKDLLQKLPRHINKE